MTINERAGMTMAPPLAGVRVVDAGRFIAAPLCAMILGDLGAEVLKLEALSGDDARALGPRVGAVTSYFAHYNRNKACIAVDLKSEFGARVREQVVRHADVVVHNFRPSVARRLGFSYDELVASRPDLVVVAISGYGQDAPDGELAVFDAIAQAESGMMRLTAGGDEAPGLIGTYPADHAAGLYGAIGALAALMRRRVDGDGELVDISLLDAAFASLGHVATAAANGVEVPTRLGNRDPASAPTNSFRAGDGDVYIDAGTDTLFVRLCKVINDDRLRVAEFSSVEGRLRHVDTLEAIITEWSRLRPAQEVVTTLADVGIPCARIVTLADACSNQHLLRRGMMRGAQEGIMACVGSPLVDMALAGGALTVEMEPELDPARILEVVGRWGGA